MPKLVELLPTLLMGKNKTNFYVQRLVVIKGM